MNPMPVGPQCNFEACFCNKYRMGNEQQELTADQKNRLEAHWRDLRLGQELNRAIENTGNKLKKKKEIILLSKIPVIRKIVSVILEKWIRKKSIQALEKECTEKKEKGGAVQERLRHQKDELAKMFQSQRSGNENRSSFSDIDAQIQASSTSSKEQYSAPWENTLRTFIGSNDAIYDDLVGLFALFCEELGEPTLEQTANEYTFRFPTKNKVMIPASACKAVLNKNGIKGITFTMQGNVVSLVKERGVVGFKKDQVQVDLQLTGMKKKTMDFGELFVKKKWSKLDRRDVLTVELRSTVPFVERAIFATITRLLGHSVRLMKVTELARHSDTQWQSI